MRDKLRSPEDVARLPEIRAVYEKQKAAADAQLSSALGAQAADNADGRALLDSSQGLLKDLQAGAASIEQLCGDTSALIQRYDLIAELSCARANAELVLSKA